LDLADPPSPARAQQEEAHDLEDPLSLVGLPGRGVDVADVAELLDDATLDTGLLAHLSRGRVCRRLAGVDVSFRQRPDAFAAAWPDRRDHRSAADRPHEHASCRELPPHDPVLPSRRRLALASFECRPYNTPGTLGGRVPGIVTESSQE